MPTKPKAVEAVPAVPAWVKHAPVEYCLTACAIPIEGGLAEGDIENLDLTECEYMELKLCLAAMRNVNVKSLFVDAIREKREAANGGN